MTTLKHELSMRKSQIEMWCLNVLLCCCHVDRKKLTWKEVNLFVRQRSNWLSRQSKTKINEMHRSKSTNVMHVMHIYIKEIVECHASTLKNSSNIMHLRWRLERKKNRLIERRAHETIENATRCRKCVFRIFEFVKSYVYDLIVISRCQIWKCKHMTNSKKKIFQNDYKHQNKITSNNFKHFELQKKFVKWWFILMQIELCFEIRARIWLNWNVNVWMKR